MFAKCTLPFERSYAEQNILDIDGRYVETSPTLKITKGNIDNNHKFTIRNDTIRRDELASRTV